MWILGGAAITVIAIGAASVAAAMISSISMMTAVLVLRAPTRHRYIFGRGPTCSHRRAAFDGDGHRGSVRCRWSASRWIGQRAVEDSGVVNGRQCRGPRAIADAGRAAGVSGAAKARKVGRCGVSLSVRLLLLSCRRADVCVSYVSVTSLAGNVSAQYRY